MKRSELHIERMSYERERNEKVLHNFFDPRNPEEKGHPHVQERLHQLIYAQHSKKKEDRYLPDWRVLAICMQVFALTGKRTMLHHRAYHQHRACIVRASTPDALRRCMLHSGKLQNQNSRVQEWPRASVHSKQNPVPRSLKGHWDPRRHAAIV